MIIPEKDVALISNDVLDRIQPAMKKRLENPEIPFDIHCHVFNYRDVPDGFLGIRLPFTTRFLSRMEHFLHRLLRKTDTDKFSNIAYFISFFKTMDPGKITEKLINYYPGEDMILVPLMMDMGPGIKGTMQHSYPEQIDHMKELRDRFPSVLLPFLAVNPHNPDMRDHFLKAFRQDGDHRFFGIKIYPSLGYLPAHPALMKIYEICQEKNIPVTAHCSGGTVHNSRKRIRQIRGWRYDPDGKLTDRVINKTFCSKRSYANFFNHPKNWEPVLASFPRLRLNLAHFGGEDQWDKYRRGRQDSWVLRIMDMMYRHPGLYADFSYTLYQPDYNRRLKQLLDENRILAGRVLYGSDYYMVVREGHFRNIRVNFFTEMGDELMKKIAVENPRKFLFGNKPAPGK